MICYDLLLSYLFLLSFYLSLLAGPNGGSRLAAMDSAASCLSVASGTSERLPRSPSSSPISRRASGMLPSAGSEGQLSRPASRQGQQRPEGYLRYYASNGVLIHVREGSQGLICLGSSASSPVDSRGSVGDRRDDRGASASIPAVASPLSIFSSGGEPGCASLRALSPSIFSRSRSPVLPSRHLPAVSGSLSPTSAWSSGRVVPLSLSNIGAGDSRSQPEVAESTPSGDTAAEERVNELRKGAGGAWARFGHGSGKVGNIAVGSGRTGQGAGRRRDLGEKPPRRTSSSPVPLVLLLPPNELGPIGKPFSGQSAGRSGQIPLHIPIEQYLVRKASSMTPD